ncbi:hypothetical protein ACVWXO_005351 [Bradyrhizobium sp. LM2.7]
MIARHQVGLFSAQALDNFIATTATRTQMICNNVLVENTLLKSVMMPPLALVTEPDSKLERLLAE